MLAKRMILFSLIALAPVSAAAEGCRFKGPLLYCLDGSKSLEAVVARFADAATTSTLKAEAEDFDRFESRAARERYRVSVERNNARAVKYVKRADRQLRRGSIDDAEYARRLAIYRAAFANYELAISRYQASYWFDPVEDADDGPDGEDDAITAKG